MMLYDVVETNRKHGLPSEREAIKYQVVMPVLGFLGWDTFNREGTNEIQFEYSVGSKKAGGRVDIALMSAQGDQCLCLVEVKAPGVNLDDHVSQLLEYAVHERAILCLLTDGLEWRLYLPREVDKPEEQRYFKVLWFLEDSIEQIMNDLETFLSRQTLRSGESVKALKLLQEHQEIVRWVPEIWHKMLHIPDTDLVDLVRSRVYAESNLSPSTDQITAMLAGRELPMKKATDTTVALHQDNTMSTTVITVDTTATQSKRKTPGKPRKIVGVTVFGIHHVVSTWYGMLLFVAEQVQARHPHTFLERASRLKGTSRDYFSNDTQNIYRPREIGTSGVYVEVNLSSGDCIKRARQLLNLFGYSESDLIIHRE